MIEYFQNSLIVLMI